MAVPMGVSKRHTEAVVRRMNIDNLKIQVRMLQALIEKEERLLESESGGESEKEPRSRENR